MIAARSVRAVRAVSAGVRAAGGFPARAMSTAQPEVKKDPVPPELFAELAQERRDALSRGERAAPPLAAPASCSHTCAELRRR